jgi:hypothetical protein
MEKHIQYALYLRLVDLKKAVDVIHNEFYGQCILAGQQTEAIKASIGELEDKLFNNALASLAT